MIRFFLVPGRMLLAAAFSASIALGHANFAHAELVGNAAGRLQYEDNSNIFNAQSGQAGPGNPNIKASDSLYAYGADLGVDYRWERQDFYATASGDQQ